MRLRCKWFTKCPPLLLLTELDYCSNYPPVTPAQENQTCPNQQDAFDSTGQLSECDGASAYVYPEFEFESSLVTEIDLVCGEEYKVRENATAYLSDELRSNPSQYPLQGCVDQQHLHERHDRRLLHRGEDHGLDRAQMGKGIHLNSS